MPLLIQNILLSKPTLIALTIILTFTAGYYLGKNNQKTKTIIAEKVINEKRTAIANKRPDDSTTIKRLRDGTF